MSTGITDALTVQPADDGPNPPPDLKLPDPDVKAETPVPPPPPPLPVPAAKKPSRWKELVVTVLLAAFVGAAVAGGTILGVEAATGRFSFVRSSDGGMQGGGNLEGRWDGDLLTQKGRVTVPASGKVEVHYPTGYTRPPAVTWKNDSQNYWSVSKQTTTGFEVTSNLGSAWDFHWEATGVGDKDDKGGRRGK